MSSSLTLPSTFDLYETEPQGVKLHVPLSALERLSSQSIHEPVSRHVKSSLNWLAMKRE